MQLELQISESPSLPAQLRATSNLAMIKGERAVGNKRGKESNTVASMSCSGEREEVRVPSHKPKG